MLLLKNRLSRIILWLFFVLFIYRILINIGVFFGLDSYIIHMYIFWLCIMLLFLSLLINYEN